MSIVQKKIKKNKIYKILKKKNKILNYLKICIFKGQKLIQKRRDYRLQKNFQKTVDIRHTVRMKDRQTD